MTQLSERNLQGADWYCIKADALQVGIRTGYYLLRAWQILKEAGAVPPP